MMFKGFNEDMTCRGFQFSQDGKYTEESANLCVSGFHACEYPLECFSYYDPSFSVYHEVELEDLSDERASGSTKRVGKSIHVRERLSSKEVLDRAIEYVSRETPDNYRWQNEDMTTIYDNTDYAAVINTGMRSTASVHGERSVANAVGTYSVACSTEDCSGALTDAGGSIAAATGDNSLAVSARKYSVAAATGFDSRANTECGDSVAVVTNRNSTASAMAENSVALATYCDGRAEASGKATAIALGSSGMARGDIGSWLILAEWEKEGEGDDWDYVMKKIHSVKVDGEKILPNVWYTVSNGEVVRAEI